MNEIRNHDGSTVEDANTTAPLFSVVTPVFETPSAWLLDGLHSLVRQTRSWEWLLQVDGPSIDLPHELVADTRVRVEANGCHCGVAVTRNLALARATGSLVLLLDADDMLGDGALEALADPLLGGDCAWASGAHLRLEEGRLSPGHGLAPGRIEPGELIRRWTAAGRRWPHQASTVCYRKDVLLAEGAFIGLARSEDIATLALVSQRHAGAIVDHVTAIRRIHPTSTSHQPANGLQTTGSYRLLLAILASRGLVLDPWTA